MACCLSTTRVAPYGVLLEHDESVPVWHGCLSMTKVAPCGMLLGHNESGPVWRAAYITYFET